MKLAEVEEAAIEYIFAEQEEVTVGGLTTESEEYEDFDDDPDLDEFHILSTSAIAENIEAALEEEEEKHHCQFTMDRLKDGPDQFFFDI